MKYLKCPQCGIENFYVKNNIGETLNIKVNREFTIISLDDSKKLEEFNLGEIYCLGCSWHGKITELKKDAR